MENYPIEQVNLAFRNHPYGGLLRPVCNRKMYGYKCRCWVRYIELGGVQYWSVNYLVNQRPATDDDHHDLLNDMRHLVHVTRRLVERQGIPVVIHDEWHNR